ncbi:hypothetical protein [Gordonia oryzae]|uniref:hypothetical protein n=1 Tax=Gordonia oryzae TaxID=2487349 RepID=UPI001FE93C5B|nr:hypothetical protein [Gordonia oryzae]
MTDATTPPPVLHLTVLHLTGLHLTGLHLTQRNDAVEYPEPGQVDHQDLLSPSDLGGTADIPMADQTGALERKRRRPRIRQRDPSISRERRERHPARSLPD